MRIDIRTERTALGLWRARAVSFQGEPPEDQSGMGLKLQVPTYDFGAQRWFYSRSADRAGDKATAWAKKRICPRERGGLTTRDVRL